MQNLRSVIEPKALYMLGKHPYHLSYILYFIVEYFIVEFLKLSI